jgi:hypothetical protein
MIRTRPILLHILLLCYNILSVQAQNQNWFLGGSQVNTDTSKYCTVQLKFTNDKLVLSKLPPYENYEFDQGSSTSLSDKNGNILLLSDGANIYDSSFRTILNGEAMNGTSVIAWRANLLLPWPGHPDSVIYLFGDLRAISFDTIETACSKKIFYSIIDLHNTANKSKVVAKNIVLRADTLLGVFSANRHANGRDFWIVLKEANRNFFYVYLLDPEGIHLHHTQSFSSANYYSQAQTAFSPDGKWYARYESDGLAPFTQFNLHPFDRCTGELGPHLFTNYEPRVQPGGVAFSPNSRFCYVSVWDSIYQYDLHTTDILQSGIVVATYDGFLADIDPDTGVYSVPTRFFQSQLAIDGKIYISTPNINTQYLHTIDLPDLPGLLCKVNQHSVEMPCQNSPTIPNLIHFELGVQKGSLCDTVVTSEIIAEPDINNAVLVAPNPNDGDFILSWQHNLEGELYIRNSIGQQIIYLPIFSNERSKSIKLYPKTVGIFYWQIVQDTKVVQSGKVFVH